MTFTCRARCFKSEGGNSKVCGCYLTSGIELSKKVKSTEFMSRLVKYKGRSSSSIKEEGHYKADGIGTCFGCSAKHKIEYQCKSCSYTYCR